MVTATTTRAALTKDAGSSAVEELPIPEPGEGALLTVEAAGICGADIPKFFKDLSAPVILGHETVGKVTAGDERTIARWGVQPDRRYLLEEYVPCGVCRACRIGRYRACARTNSRDPNALRYGTTPVTRDPSLWGGFSEVQYLDPNTVLHEVPENVPSDVATFALPLSNGVQWMVNDAGVRAGESVFIQGPGQQGLACLIAAKVAGCGPVIVSGLAQDAQRLELARSFGADATLVADEQDVAAEIAKIVGGDGVDVVADISGAGAPALTLAMDVARRGGRIVTAAVNSNDTLPGASTIVSKEITLRGVRGHGYDAVEKALAWLGNGSVDISSIHQPTYGLEDVPTAFGRLRASDAIHLVIDPRK